LWNDAKPAGFKRQILRLLFFAAGLGICVGAYLAYNYARFGDAFQTGYIFIPLDGFLKTRVDQYGLFNIAYLPSNFFYMFLQPPIFIFDRAQSLWPIDMDGFGTSLLWASPFVLAAVFGRWNKYILLGAWTSIGLMLAGGLLYYNNGWVQWNTERFSLDFLPVLILLAALGMQRARTPLWKATIAYAAALNAFLIFVLLPRIR
jgi:hypothetical protein